MNLFLIFVQHNIHDKTPAPNYLLADAVPFEKDLGALIGRPKPEGSAVFRQDSEVVIIA